MKTIQRTTLALICFAGLLGAGGCGKDYFVCTQDSECTQEEGGRCEPSGACSFPDPSCPTGRRYGEEGNPQVAGNCVPESDIGSTGVVATESGTGSSSTQVGSSDGSGTSGTTSNATETMTGSTGGNTSTGGESTSSTGGGSSSSTGEPIPVREFFQPCTTETQDADCPNSVCIELFGRVSSGFCSQSCRKTAVCHDPGTGAAPACIISSVDGTPGGSCALECSDSGADGCPNGMSCSPMAQLPDGTNVRLCYFP